MAYQLICVNKYFFIYSILLYSIWYINSYVLVYNFLYIVYYYAISGIVLKVILYFFFNLNKSLQQNLAEFESLKFQIMNLTVKVDSIKAFLTSLIFVC